MKTKVKNKPKKKEVKNQPRDKPHFAISSLNDRQKANDEKVIKKVMQKLKENWPFSDPLRVNKRQVEKYLKSLRQYSIFNSKIE